MMIAAYLLCIIGANWTTQHYGMVGVGFGLTATAGTWFAGIAFSARDGVQRTSGRTWVVVIIVIGATLSWFVAPDFAVASGVAFLVSELVDMAIYTPLYRRRPYASVIISNTVGATLDAWLFLWIAFGSIRFWEGNVVGKLWTILPVLALMWIWRRRDLPERVRSPRPAV
jgi:uncharacterized PurR-regulated membrane protein YhhQ (DUF165 family)